jgi:hypothetical protein
VGRADFRQRLQDDGHDIGHDQRERGEIADLARQIVGIGQIEYVLDSFPVYNEHGIQPTSPRQPPDTAAFLSTAN